MPCNLVLRSPPRSRIASTCATKKHISSEVTLRRSGEAISNRSDCFIEAPKIRRGAASPRLIGIIKAKEYNNCLASNFNAIPFDFLNDRRIFILHILEERQILIPKHVAWSGVVCHRSACGWTRSNRLYESVKARAQKDSSQSVEQRPPFRGSL